MPNMLLLLLHLKSMLAQKVRFGAEAAMPRSAVKAVRSQAGELLFVSGWLFAIL